MIGVLEVDGEVDGILVGDLEGGMLEDVLGLLGGELVGARAGWRDYGGCTPQGPSCTSSRTLGSRLRSPACRPCSRCVAGDGGTGTIDYNGAGAVVRARKGLRTLAVPGWTSVTW